MNPELVLSCMPEIVQCVNECNGLPVHPRHPYAGELVFTAFSGNHRDAIKKYLEAEDDGIWDITYVEMDIDGHQQVDVATSQDTVGAMFKATLAAYNQEAIRTGKDRAGRVMSEVA